MKKLIPPVIVLIALTSIIYPTPQIGQAATANKYDQQINEKRKIAEEARKQQQVIENEKTSVDQERKALQGQIEEMGKQVMLYESQILLVTAELEETNGKLEQIQERLNARDELLKARIRLKYMNTADSYLSVLMSSDSFADFVDRYSNILTIVEQDQLIIEDRKRDLAEEEEKKKEKESKRTKIKSLYDERSMAKLNLEMKEREKEVKLAKLDEQEHHLDEISEEADKAADELVAAKREQARKDAIAESKRSNAGNKNNSNTVTIANFSGGKFGWPSAASTRITSEFGYRIDPVSGQGTKLHKGLDIGAASGSAILAAGDGKVIHASWISGYGNTVIIDHGGGYETWYAHIRVGGIKVSEGDQVTKGQTIAEVGSTGNSTGPHLHFEVRIDGVAKDPYPFLTGK